MKMQKFSLFIWTISCAWLLACNSAFARFDKEMEKLVTSGIEHIKKVSKDKAYKDFSNIHGKFIKNGNYLFVYDFHGKCLAHGGDSNKYVGKNLFSLKDKFGIQIVKLVIDVAKSGGGFVGYYWPNSKTGVEQFKVAYIKPLDKDALIGTSQTIPMD